MKDNHQETTELGKGSFDTWLQTVKEESEILVAQAKKARRSWPWWKKIIWFAGNLWSEFASFDWRWGLQMIRLLIALAVLSLAGLMASAMAANWLAMPLVMILGGLVFYPWEMKKDVEFYLSENFRLKQELSGMRKNRNRTDVLSEECDDQPQSKKPDQ